MPQHLIFIQRHNFFHSLNQTLVLSAKQQPIMKLKYSVPFCTSLNGTRKAEFIVSPHDAQHHLLAFHKPDKSLTNQPRIETAIELSEVVSKISWMNFNTSLLQEKVSVAKASAANFNFLLPIKNSLQIYIFIYIHTHTFTCHCWIIHLLSFCGSSLHLKSQVWMIQIQTQIFRRWRVTGNISWINIFHETLTPAAGYHLKNKFLNSQMLR